MQPGIPAIRLPEERVPVPILQAYRRLSDLALVTKARAGDRSALHVLVERSAPRVNRIAATLMVDLEDARDAAQESLVKLCTKLRQFRGDAQFSTWLHRLTVNTCRDLQDKKRIRETEPLADTDELAGDESDPAWASALADLRRDLTGALGRLSPDQRSVVFLRDVLGLSYEEIAGSLRVPVGTAKCYVHRGRARMRTVLEERLPAGSSPADAVGSRS
jgi:RNA polymerase sigma-70 factor (ECF subfamily)